MKKNIRRSLEMFSVLIVILVLYGCSNIPVVSSMIPPDPTGTTKPTVDDYATDNIFVSIDKMPTLVPIAISDSVNVRISLPNVENLEAANIRIFEDNKEQGFVLRKESEERNKLDIAIILDVTGSMANAITGAKNSIIAFAEALEESGLDVRLGVVPYDDYVNPPSDIDVASPYLNLSEPDDVETYVNTLYAGNGGDTPENLYDGIMFAATAMNWRPYAQRSMIVITDAPSHYEGDGYSFTHFTKSEMLSELVGYVTVHGAFAPGYYYVSSATDFSAPGDPREICQRTSGIIKYTDSYGNVDLTDLGIVEYVTSSWIAAFESDSPEATHTIEVFYATDSTKRYAKFQNVSY